MVHISKTNKNWQNLLTKREWSGILTKLSLKAVAAVNAGAGREKEAESPRKKWLTNSKRYGILTKLLMSSTDRGSKTFEKSA